MQKIYRKIFFWGIFILFLISTPLVIMHSKGYRFDQKRGIFVYSGSVTLKTIPSSVRIFINNEEQPSRSLDIINNSITLNGLKPGTYKIRVTADGYLDWEKQVEVHSGLSSEFWNVVLMPQNPQLKGIESHKTARLFPSPFGKKIAYFEDLENNIFLWVTDFKENKTQLIFSKDNVSASRDRLENLEWNFKEDLMLIPVTRNNQKDYLIASASQDLSPIYLSEISRPGDIIKARWSPQEKNVIYFLARSNSENKSNLYRVSLDNNTLQLIIPGVIAYDLSQNSIYYIQENNILFKGNLEGGNITQINDNQFTDQPIGDGARLIAYDNERQALISQDGDLFVHNNGNESLSQKIASSVQGVQFSDDGKKLLFGTPNEIFVMFLRKWEVQPYRDENEIQNVIRISSPLENVFWFRDYEHILFSVDKKIKLIELDPRDRRICLDVFENNLDDFPAVYDTSNGYYFFLRDESGDKRIFYFTLPEKTGIFR